jgi:hypothetical protein
MSSLSLSEATEALKNPEFTDFVIKCSDEVSFKVHKFLICAKSEFLSACVKGPFRERLEGELVVRDTTAFAVASVVYFVYTGGYDIKAIQAIWPELSRPSLSSHDQAANSKTDSIHREEDAGELTAADEATYTKTRRGSTLTQQLEQLKYHIQAYLLADRL